MKGYVNGIDWINAEAMKYWSFPANYTKDKTVEAKNLVFSGEYVGALKVDGYYERLVKDEDGNCFMIARSKGVNGAVDKIEWVPQISGFMKDLPNGTVLLSECYLPGDEGSRKITTLLGCLKEKCVARQEKENKMLHFYIFDVMAYNNISFVDVKAEERYKMLGQIQKKHQSSYVGYAVYYDGKELWDNLQSYLASGREGMVIMRKDAKVYFKRTPARVSLKIKKELQETIDCFFTGRMAPPTRLYSGKEIENWKYWVNVIDDSRLKEGEHYKEYYDGLAIEPVTKPYYYNFAGSLEIGVVKNKEVYPIGYISGLTDEIKEHWKDYRGRCIEVGAMMIDETGGLRHAKMIGFRDDIKPIDCTYEKVFGN